MPHTNAWNELKPAGTDLASTIDDQMRQMKKDVRERMSLEHIWGESQDNDGKHRNLTFTAANNASLIRMDAPNTLDADNAQSLLDLQQIWNTTGRPLAIRLQVTDTASAADSLFLSLERDGIARYIVDKNGFTNQAGGANFGAGITVDGAVSASGAASFGGTLTALGGSIVLNGVENVIPGDVTINGVLTADAITGGIASNGDFTVTGLLTVQDAGFFTKNFAGSYGVTIQNLNAGATSYAVLQIGNDASTVLGRLMSFASGYGGTTLYTPSTFVVESTGGGGLNLAANAGAMRFFTSGATERMRIMPSGRVGIGTGSPVSTFEVAGGYATTGLTVPQGIAFASQSGNVDRVQVMWGDGTGYKMHFGPVLNAGSTFSSRIVFTDTGKVQTAYDGAVGSPALGFVTADAGLYMTLNGLFQNIAFGLFGENGLMIGKSNDNVMGLSFDGVHPREHAQWGGGFTVYRRSTVAGAPGYIAFQAKNGTRYFVWVDSVGKLRINSAGPPNNSDGVDTIGTVVGSQVP